MKVSLPNEIAGTAAIAAFAQHGNSQPLRAVRDQIDENGPSSHDLPMIDALASGATQSAALKTMLNTEHQRLIEDGIPAQRDADWQRTRPARPPSPASRL